MKIYKWFWDTKAKMEKGTQLACKLGWHSSQSEIDQEASDVKNSPQCFGVDARDGTGKKLTAKQIKTALRFNQESSERLDDSV